MPIRFACATCDVKLSVSSTKAGLGIRCPGCGASIRVPGGTRSSHLAVSAAEPAAQADPADAREAPPAVWLSDPPPVANIAASEIKGEHGGLSPMPFDPRMALVPRRAIYLHALLIVIVAAAFCALGWWLAQ